MTMSGHLERSVVSLAHRVHGLGAKLHRISVAGRAKMLVRAVTQMQLLPCAWRQEKFGSFLLHSADGND